MGGGVIMASTDLMPIIYADDDLAEDQVWEQDVLLAASGAVAQVREWQTAPAWRTTVKLTRTPSDLLLLQTFLRARRGQADNFSYYTLDPYKQWANVQIGVGDGGQRAFFFPGRLSGSGTTYVYINGSPLGAYWSVTTPGDSLSRQCIQFEVGHAPTSGQIITVTWTGYRLLLGRLASPFSCRTSEGKWVLDLDLLGREQ